MEDVRKNYSTRNLLSYMVYKLLGGSKNDHAFTNVPVYTLNIFAGCSAGIFKHFWQIWKNQRFEGYDYGKRKNEEIYGSSEPINFFENYDKIDIPVYFVMGLRDTLIEPVSVLAHYASLHEQHPNLAYLKAFPKMGHIDFTVGENSKVTNFIFHTISELNQPKKVLEEHATHSSTESDKEFFYETQQKISSDKGQTTVKKTTKKNYHNKKKATVEKSICTKCSL